MNGIIARRVIWTVAAPVAAGAAVWVLYPDQVHNAEALRGILTALSILTGFLMAAMAFVSSTEDDDEPVTEEAAGPAKAVTRFLFLLYAYLTTLAVLVAALFTHTALLDAAAVFLSVCCWVWTLSVPYSISRALVERLNKRIADQRKKLEEELSKAALERSAAWVERRHAGIFKQAKKLLEEGDER